MRLTQIKLAGFKTFVDPTTIHFPGQRVGVVGPNGCGKSTVIDAMRWVLGESSARQLRGESMQDVIFNGSGTRKPVGRASVELVFDNNLGKAAGQWSQYAEIAVKRVLHRNGESGYYINNLQVRRKDITDIFLGTGLGARAYAIIEQGMISRIIEARPEELRVFLEEAAGISKYKERRRETELRMKDARENLLRVEDVRQELDKQIGKLETQAEVAGLYLSLQGRLKLAQNLLALLRKREAAAQCERWQREVERLNNELEAETARLRQAESQLEQARTAHYALSDVLHETQGSLYAANAEVSRMEQNLLHLRENRQRLALQIAALREQNERLVKQRGEALAALELWRGDHAAALERMVQGKEQLELEIGNLPLAEQGFRDCQRRYNDLQSTLAQAEQAKQVEETHRIHAQRNLQQLQARQQRLQQEINVLPRFDATLLAHKEADLAALTDEREAAQEELAQLLAELPEAGLRAQQARGELEAAQNLATGLGARLDALEHLQSRLGNNHELQAWLAQHQLENLPRLWSGLRIDAGWDDALESVLGERLNGIALAKLDQARDWSDAVPPAALTIFEAVGTDQAAVPGGKFTPLRRYVSWLEGAAPAFLDDWLDGVYVAEDVAAGFDMRHDLPRGAMLVTREGHVITRYSAHFHGPQSDLHGVLARQREIGELQGELDICRAALAQQQVDAAQAEAALALRQKEIALLRNTVEESQQKQHHLQLEVQRLAQVKQQAEQRHMAISAEQSEIAEQLELESERMAATEETLLLCRDQVEALRTQMEASRQERSGAERQLEQQREALRTAERAVQEAVFIEQNCRNKIGEMESSSALYAEQAQAAAVQLESLLAEQQGLSEEPQNLALQQALAQRQQKEQALSMARDALADAANQLRDLEQQRMASEQKLQPLRDQIGETRLKEQEARLSQEQYAGQIREAGVDEAELAQQAEKSLRPNALQADIARLMAEIEALGAVNLAALDELQTSQERRGYLESQANDLNEAIDTLEQAIRRIDRETRERLQSTFDEVNRNFGELFPSLFGGGQARLVLTGEEILDAGVQIIAQPPGKKNSSIHLLSGGEKALTALALTFSMFQLNPAPFCLLDEVDAPLDDSNTERFCELVKKMSLYTQFVFISHNKITMEMAEQLVGVTMQEMGVSRVVAVDIEEAMRMKDEMPA
ncbi:MAG: chromosome segregation protein SMC [Betaproteobacteria bacterium]|nr:chromosome segregation protein SMC [Betaproteobacteria bacterium]